MHFSPLTNTVLQNQACEASSPQQSAITFPTHAKTFTCKQKSGTVAKLEAFKKSEQVIEDRDLILHHFHITEVIYVDS